MRTQLTRFCFLHVTDRMINWIKHGIEKVVPQPEIHIRAKAERSEKTQPAPAPKPGADIDKYVNSSSVVLSCSCDSWHTLNIWSFF